MHVIKNNQNIYQFKFVERQSSLSTISCKVHSITEILSIEFENKQKHIRWQLYAWSSVKKTSNQKAIILSTCLVCDIIFDCYIPIAWQSAFEFDYVQIYLQNSYDYRRINIERSLIPNEYQIETYHIIFVSSNVNTLKRFVGLHHRVIYSSSLQFIGRIISSKTKQLKLD